MGMSSITRRLLLTAGLLLAAPVAPASAGPWIVPVDEAVQDPSLQAFRLRMLEALAARDLDTVLAHVQPDVVNDGVKQGREQFGVQWRISEGAPDLWQALAGVLAAGGLYARSLYGNDGEAACADSRSTGPTFSAPYWRVLWPNDVKRADHAVAVRPNVAVRSRPEPHAPVVERLHWEIVTTGEKRAGWIAVTLADQRQGWVEAPAVRNAQGPYLHLERCDGRWWIGALFNADRR